MSVKRESTVYPLSVGRAASPSFHGAICDRARSREAHAEQRVPSGCVCLSQYQEVRVSVRPAKEEDWCRVSCSFAGGFRIEANSLSHCQWMYDMFTHYELAWSWYFVMMEKQLCALMTCFKDRRSKVFEETTLSLFTYLLFPPLLLNGNLARLLMNNNMNNNQNKHYDNYW